MELLPGTCVCEHPLGQRESMLELFPWGKDEELNIYVSEVEQLQEKTREKS